MKSGSGEPNMNLDRYLQSEIQANAILAGFSFILLVFLFGRLSQVLKYQANGREYILVIAAIILIMLAISNFLIALESFRHGLHPTRRNERGFTQAKWDNIGDSHFFCGKISLLLGIFLAFLLLMRVNTVWTLIISVLVGLFLVFLTFFLHWWAEPKSFAERKYLLVILILMSLVIFGNPVAELLWARFLSYLIGSLTVCVICSFSMIIWRSKTRLRRL